MHMFLCKHVCISWDKYPKFNFTRWYNSLTFENIKLFSIVPVQFFYIAVGEIRFLFIPTSVWCWYFKKRNCPSDRCIIGGFFNFSRSEVIILLNFFPCWLASYILFPQMSHISWLVFLMGFLKIVLWVFSIRFTATMTLCCTVEIMACFLLAFPLSFHPLNTISQSKISVLLSSFLSFSLFCVIFFLSSLGILCPVLVCFSFFLKVS